MTTIPMFPLGSALLPGQLLPLNVFEPRYHQLVLDCLASPEGPVFGVVLIARGSEVGGGDVRNDVGVLARIEQHTALSEGSHELRCRTQERIRVRKWLPDNPYPVAEVELWSDENAGTQTVDYEFPALVERIELLYGLLNRLARQRGKVPPSPPTIAPFRGSLGTRLFELAELIPMGDADRYAVLSAPGADERLRVVGEALETAIDMVRFRLG
ncbi:MAG: ATP-dependent protease [Rhodococcus sp.]|nr:ATP-dependent protease [Rhodococcus sp. (in: high G+C Gram-positive bacteria)]